MTTPNEMLAEVLARIPYVAHLGVHAELHGDQLTAVMPFSERLIGNPLLPALHGGVIGGFMELTAVIQLSMQSGDRAPKPIDVTVEYLRTGRPRDTFARAEIKKVGRRIANVQVEAWQEARSKPIAALRGHFLLTSASS